MRILLTHAIRRRRSVAFNGKTARSGSEGVKQHANASGILPARRPLGDPLGALPEASRQPYTETVNVGPILTLSLEISNPSSPPGESLLPGSGGNSAAIGPSVAIGTIDGDAVTLQGIEPVRPGLKREDDLIPAIDRMMRRARVAPSAIRRIAVSAGPGGFTGLRVSIAAAKMIALATGARCVAVPTAMALVHAVPPAERAGRACTVLLSWKRDDVWRECFAPESMTPDPARVGLVRVEDALKDQEGMLIADLALIERMHPPASIACREPQFDAASVLACSARLPEIDSHALEPIYPREPEAVTKWRALHARD